MAWRVTGPVCQGAERVNARARSNTPSSHLPGQPAGEGVLLAGVVAARRSVHVAAAPPPRRGRTSASAAARRAPAATSDAQGAVPAEGARARPRRARVGSTSRSSRRSQGAQVSRSAAVGLLSGGAQRTAATIRASDQPLPVAGVDGWSAWPARPARCSAAKSQSPDRSPVKIRPVRLPPFAAGASPTTSTRGVGVAPAGDRPAPVGLVGERRPLVRGDVLPPAHQPRAGAADATPGRRARRGPPAASAPRPSVGVVRRPGCPAPAPGRRASRCRAAPATGTAAR